MFFDKNSRKRRNPYAMLTVFSLAAAGAISIVNKGKHFIKDKAQSVCSMVKNMKME